MSSRVILIGALALSLAATATLAFLYRSTSAAMDKLEAERAAICNTRASRLTSLVADKSDLDLRLQVKPLADQFVSKMCLGTPTPVNIDDANRCWADTGSESCYRVIAEKLQPLYAARGWR